SISSWSQYDCIIHGDPNSTNVLFSGLPCFENVSTRHQISLEDVLNPKTKISLFDYELSARCPLVYDLAFMFYLCSGFPRNYENILNRKAMKKVINHYFEEIKSLNH
ncbi:MAG: hypothetical protein MHPSP_002322, partial [Paramarteilia canceri]